MPVVLCRLLLLLLFLALSLLAMVLQSNDIKNIKAGSSFGNEELQQQRQELFIASLIETSGGSIISWLVKIAKKPGLLSSVSRSVTATNFT